MISTRRRALSLSTTHFEQKQRSNSVCFEMRRSSSEESFDFENQSLPSIWYSVDTLLSDFNNHTISSNTLGDIFGEKLYNELWNKSRCDEFFKASCSVIAVKYQDVCDGIMDDAMPVTLSEDGESRQWLPRRISENEVIEAKFLGSSTQLYAWYVADSTEHFVFGFKDSQDPKKYFYVTVLGENHLRISSDFDPPYTISPSDVSSDPRVLKYYKSEKLGKYVLKSTKFPELFISVEDGYVKAVKVDERDAKPWSMS